MTRYIGHNEMEIRRTPASLHVLRWGNLTAILADETRHYDKQSRNKIREMINSESGDWYKYDLDLLTQYQPAPAKDDPSKMGVYESHDKYSREIRTIGKPARMIKRILPHLDESQCNAFAVWWAETYCAAPMQYTVEDSTEESDFVAAYKSEQSKTYDPTLCTTAYNFGTKSLQNSCMRHDFDDLPTHPAATYASGDFKIVFAKDSKGRIAGRALVSIARTGVLRDKPRAGYIYTTSDTVSELISQHLIAMGCVSDSNWHGSRMTRVEHNNGFVLPYVDGFRTLADHGAYLVYDRDGDIEASETGGLVIQRNVASCDMCGDGYDPDNEGYYTDSHGCVCDDCLNRHFFSYEGEYYHNSEGVSVMRYTRWGIDNETVPRNTAESGYGIVLCADGEYWFENDCVYVESAEEYYPMRSDDIFESEIDGVHYLMTDCVTHDEKAMTIAQRDEILATQQLELELTA